MSVGDKGEQQSQAEEQGAAEAAEAEDEDEENGEAAPPAVPPGYEHLLKKPVEATITAVGRRRVSHKLSFKGDHAETFYEHASLTNVTIDAGTSRGLKDGMFLLVKEPDEGDRIRIVRAGKRSSTAYVIRELEDDGRETFTDGDSERPHTKVSIGWKLTTSRF